MARRTTDELLNQMNKDLSDAESRILAIAAMLTAAQIHYGLGNVTVARAALDHASQAAQDHVQMIEALVEQIDDYSLWPKPQ